MEKYQKAGYRIRGKDGIMPENGGITAEQKRRRVQRLKKCIVLMLMLTITVPIGLCVFLFIRVHSLNKTLDMLLLQVESLTGAVDIGASGICQRERSCQQMVGHRV